MRRKFDPSVLFARWKQDPKLVAFKSEEAHLDAIEAREKALMYVSLPVSYIAEGGRGFVALLRGAFARGLAVTIYNGDPSHGPREPDVYVLPLDQTWRISALGALRETARVGGPWTLAAEAQESLLLGYTAKQRRTWLAATKERQSAYGCKTIYTLLTVEQKAMVVSLGKRCLGSASDLVGRSLFFHRNDDPLKNGALKLVPKGQTLARVGLDWKTTEALFGSWETMKKRGLVSGTVSDSLAPRVTAALRSNVEFLTATGWQ